MVIGRAKPTNDSRRRTETALTITINNTAAQIALQNLAKTQDQAAANATQAAAGPVVGDAQDSSAILATLQNPGGSIRAANTVTVSLNRAASVSDTANAGGQSVADLLDELKSKASAATNPATSSASRASLNSDYKALLGQIQTVIDSASFGGINLINGSQTAGASFVASADGSQSVTLSATNLSLGGPIVSVTSTSSIGTVTAATAALSDVTTSLANVSQALNVLGGQSKQVAAHVSFVSHLNDASQTGVGSLINGDLGREGAMLMALQVQQQLGSQSLSIANQSPQALLALFRA
jgi:flagellin